MAGSLRHIVGDDGKFTMDLIENMGDAWEALEECFNIILAMSGGSTVEVNYYLRALDYPEIHVDMVKDDSDA